MPLHIKGFEFNMFGETTYLVWDDDSLETSIVDAGMSTDAERHELDSFIEQKKLKIKYLLNTHVHLDHAFGVPYAEERYGLRLSASPFDEPLADRIEQQAVLFHLPIKPSNVVITNLLYDGDVIKLGISELYVIEVPGHTPGGLAFHSPNDHFVLTGDSLFHSSIGRTDLPGGDHTLLVSSVTEKLLSLPADTIVYPGHGPSTTIGHERLYNPFL